MITNEWAEFFLARKAAQIEVTWSAMCWPPLTSCLSWNYRETGKVFEKTPGIELNRIYCSLRSGIGKSSALDVNRINIKSESFHYSFSTYHFVFACTTQTRFFATISFAFCLQTFTVSLSVWRTMPTRMFLTNSLDFFLLSVFHALFVHTPIKKRNKPNSISKKRLR